MATMKIICLMVLIQIRYRDISKAQKTDAKLQQKLVSHKYYTLDNFREGDQNHRLICQNSNCRLVSRDDLSSGRDSNRAYPPSTFWLERTSHNSPRRV